MLLSGALIYLLLLVSVRVDAAVTSRPVDKFQCPETCNGENPVVNFGVLRSHRYEFKIVHRITSAAQEKSGAGLKISGIAVISGGTNCTYEINLEVVEASDVNSDGVEVLNMKLAEILQERPAYFGYEEGQVTAFCPAEDEHLLARNMKAAILSHLQADLKSGKLPSETIEKDVSGRCLTKFEILDSSEEGLTFEKRKPTAGCADKYSLVTRFDGVTDSDPGALSKHRAIDGEQSCRLTVKFNKPVSEVTCTETFSLKAPFGIQWKNLNTITIKTQLKLLSSDSSGSIDFDGSSTYVHTSLNANQPDVLFEAVESREPSEIESLLDDVANDKRVATTRDFLLLVEHIRRSTAEELEALESHSESEVVLGLLFDASIYAQTEASMQFLKWCLTASEFAVPVTKFSFLTKPSLEFILATKEALKDTDHRTLTIVLSNLLRTYCKDHFDCRKEEAVRELIKGLEYGFSNSCRYAGQNELNEVLDSLRAIGNLGMVSDPDTVYPILRECLQPSPDRDLIVQVTTAEAFRRFSPDSQVDEALLDVIKDNKQDVEVRIQAYRSWARYITESKLHQLPFFEDEENEQVKYYIYSHLSALQKSHDRSKQDLSHLLSNVDSPIMEMVNEFVPNPFKQSFYAEKYAYGGQFGGGIDASIIYGPQSTLPRSVNLNMTLDIMGYSFNLLEIGFHSVYSENLRNQFFGRHDGKEKSKVNDFPSIEDKIDPHNQYDNRSRLAVRMYGRDVIFNDDIENTDQSVFEIRPDFSLINETVAFTTIGGITIQINQLVALHQENSFYNGGNTKYGFNIGAEATCSFNVVLNVPDGSIGYSTDNKFELNAPVVFTVDLLDRIREFTGFEVGLLGVDSNFRAFKTSQSVRAIFPKTQSAMILSGGEIRPIRGSPALLKTLIGLEATLNYAQDPTSSLITGYELKVDRFDGLFVSFIKEKPSLSDQFRSLKIEVKRYTAQKTGFATSSELIKLSYLTREINGDSNTYVTLKFPWNSTYSLSVNCNKEGEFTGDLKIGEWGANVTGNVKHVGPSDYEVSAQVLHPDFSLSLNHQAAVGKRYALAAESTSPLLPFVFKSSLELDTPEGTWHRAELQLPSRRSTIQTEGLVKWAPRDHRVHLSLSRDMNGEARRWMGQFVAVNNIGMLPTAANQTIYNFSLITGIEQDRQSYGYWSIASSAVRKERSSSSWDFESRHQFCDYHSKLTFGINKLSSPANRVSYTFNGCVKNLDKLLFETNGTVNLDDLVLVDGYLNSRIYHEKVCQGEVATLTANLSNTGAKKLLEAFTSCGDRRTFEFKEEMDPLNRRNSIQIRSGDDVQLRIESSGTLRITQDRVIVRINSSIFSRDEHQYDSISSFTISKRDTDFQYLLTRVPSGGVAALATIAVSKAPYLWVQIDLPGVVNGTLVDVGFGLNKSENIASLNSRALMKMDSKPYGFELQASKAITGVLPLRFSSSIHGLERNKSITFNLNLHSDPKGLANADLSLKTHRDDEVIFKVLQNIESSTDGEISLLVSLHPGVKTETFTGFLYKAQVSWAFNAEALKVGLQGEWNGNRASPPGMPFRYGISRSFNSLTGGEEVQAYAEDTNMGKVFGFEMLEALFMYELEDSKGGSVGLRSDILLNWRRFLGRGVVGSQATFSARLDKEMRDGSVEASFTLPDANQTLLEAEVKYKVEDDRLAITSKAMMGQDQAHEGNLVIQRQGERYEIELEGQLADYGLEVECETKLTSLPSFEFDLKAKKGDKLWMKVEITAVDSKPPHFKLSLYPLNREGGLKYINAKLTSQTKLQDMNAKNFDIEGHYRTQPNLENCKFKLRVNDELRIVETYLAYGDADAQHKETTILQLSEDRRGFFLKAHLESPLISNGPIDISLDHDSSSDHKYGVDCSDPEKCAIMVSKVADDRSNFSATYNSLSGGLTATDVRFGNKHFVSFISNRSGDLGTAKLAMQLGDDFKAELEGSGRLLADTEAFAIDLVSKLTNEKNEVISLKVNLSNTHERQAIDVAFASNSNEYGKHNVDIRSDLTYFLSCLSNGKADQNRLKNYFLRIDDHALGIEFKTASSCMVTASLPDLSVPLVLRMAFDLEQYQSWRAILQVNEPLQIDIRGILGSKQDISLALANRVDVMGSLSEARLSNLIVGENEKFLKSACAHMGDDCMAIIFGSDTRASNQLKLLGSMIFPMFGGKVDSIIVTTEFDDKFPRALYLASNDREFGLGVWVDKDQNAFVTEIAWNRQKGGVIVLTISENSVAFGNHMKRLDFGRDGQTYYFRARDLRSGEVTPYLEITVQQINKLEFNSYLLTHSILITYEQTGNKKLLKLYKGANLESRNSLTQFSMIEEPLDNLRSRIIIEIKREGRSVLIDTIKDKSAAKQTINSTITIDGKSGNMYFEYVPGRSTFLNFNDNLVCEVTREIKSTSVLGNALFHYRDGTVKFDGNFRASAMPAEIFAGVQTAKAEAVLQGQESSPFNVEARLWHTYAEGENVLDGQLLTNLDEESGRLSLNSYWRPGALTELLFGGLESLTAEKIPVFMAELEENLMALVNEELSDIMALFNRTRTAELWQSVGEYAREFVISLEVPTVSELANISDTEVVEKAEALHSKLVTIIDRLGGWIEKLDPRLLYESDAFTKGARKLESFIQRSIVKIDKGVRDLLWVYEKTVSYMYNIGRASGRLLKMVLIESSDELSSAYDQFAENAEDLKMLRDNVKSLSSEVHQTLLGIKAYGEDNFGPVLQSLKATFFSPFKTYEETPDKGHLNTNLREISLNASILIPLWLRRAADPDVTVIRSLPLAQSSFDWALLSGSQMAIPLEIVCLTASQIASRLLIPDTNRAWLFLSTGEKVHIITFRRRLVGLEPHTNSVLLLAYDATKKEVAFTCEFGPEHALFVYHRGREKVNVTESGALNGNANASSTIMGEGQIYFHRRRGLWRLHDEAEDIAFTFFQRERILYFEAGLLWSGRLQGAMDLSGVRATYPDDWIVSQNTPEAWLKMSTRKESMNQSISLQNLDGMLLPLSKDPKNCPLEPFVRLIMSSSPICGDEGCAYSREVVLHAKTALASCLDKDYNGCPEATMS